MSEPLVSILIPCFNAAQFVEETIESALAQTHQALEIIAIDDGSSDSTYDLLRRFQGRIQVERQQNVGASITRNRLIERASGGWLQFLDADDLLDPRAVEQRLACARASDANAVYSNWRKFSGDAGAREYRPAQMQPMAEVSEDAELATFTTFWAPPAAWLFEARLIRQAGGFRADLPVIQDARLLQDCAHLGARFAFVDQVLAAYREARSDSLSQRNRAQFLHDCLLNAEQILERWQALGSLGEPRRVAVAACFDFVARGLFVRDPAGFERAYSGLKQINAITDHAWPRIAKRLKRVLGVRAATAALRALRRAPEGR